MTELLQQSPQEAPLPSSQINRSEYVSVPIGEPEGGRVTWVFAHSSSEGKVYLVPRTSGDDRGCKERVQALRENGIPCHVLPAEKDTYTAEEYGFATEIAGESALAGSAPLVLGPEHERGIIFNPSSVKSVLDVMIMTGHDSPELREARLAEVRGEPNEITAIVRELLRYGIANETEDTKAAEVLSTAYGFSNSYDKPTDIVYGLVAIGASDVKYKMVKKGLYEIGIDPRLIREVLDIPEEVQQIATQGWRSFIEAAKQYNTAAGARGVYTEIHRIGDVLVVLPAITSTEWAAHDSLGYVDISGGGHTLADIYAEYGSVVTLPGEISEDVDSAIRGSELLELAAKVGILSNGRATLQRRCLTTFDETGTPTIHLREDDPYNNIDRRYHRRGHMTNEYINDLLAAQGIASDIKDKDGAVIVRAERSSLPVSVSVHESEKYALPKPDSISGSQIACVTSIESHDDGLAVGWSVGYANRHADLFQEANPESETSGFIKVMLGGEVVQLRGSYVNIPSESVNGGDQYVFWTISGGVDVVRRQANDLMALIDAAGSSLGRYSGGGSGEDGGNLYTTIQTEDKNGEVIPIKFSYARD